MRKWMQIICKLFRKRNKIHPLPMEKVEEKEADLQLEESADESTCRQEILLSIHRIVEKHVECSENLLREITKLTDVIENTQETSVAEMESTASVTVSQASAPAKKSFLPFRSSCPFFSWTKIRLPLFKKLKRSGVESSTMSSVQTDDLKSSKSISFSLDANQCSGNTEEMMPEKAQMNDVEVQTVDVMSTEEEPIGPMLDKMLDEPLDEKENLLEMEFNVKIAEWTKIKNEERVKLKRKIDGARQRRHREIENLKLRVKVMERKNKHQKQMEKKKLKDLAKEVKDEKAKLLLELEELKQKLKMEKMAEHEAEDKPAPKRKFKISFKFWGLKKKI